MQHRCKVRAGPGPRWPPDRGAGSSSSSSAQRCLTAIQRTRLIVLCRSSNRRPTAGHDVPPNVPDDGSGEHPAASTAGRPSMSFGATRGRARHGAAAASSAHACEHIGRSTATRTHARTRCAHELARRVRLASSHTTTPDESLACDGAAARPCRRSGQAASHSHPCVACAHVLRCRCRWA